MLYKESTDLNHKKSSGQALVEFALILVVMIGLFVGTFEIMTLYRKRTDLATATRMAARQASELYIQSSDPADFKDEVENYVYIEMERMGYDSAWMQQVGTDGLPNVSAVIKAFEYDPTFTDVSNGSSHRETSAAGICNYGQYIQVELTMKWEFVVVPLGTTYRLLTGNSNDDLNSGSLTEEVVVRCWRGS